LVVRRAADLGNATRLAAKTSYGLAASLLGGNRSDFEKFVIDVGAGVVNWNRPTTGAAGTLPFGGLAHSGNHRPAGFFAVDFCNEPVASLEFDQPDASNPWSIVR
jgi:succinylglutamic semialdehyde dehydrogenase